MPVASALVRPKTRNNFGQEGGAQPNSSLVAVSLLSRSLHHPFAVPTGLIGAIWTLPATNTTLNVEPFLGILVMVGIVVSNSIPLVDFANQRRRRSASLRRAVESARIRMRPRYPFSWIRDL